MSKMLRQHIVTKGSDDGTFEVGDHIFYEKDGAILCLEAEGWIDKEEVPSASAGMKSEPDLKWLQTKKKQLRAELDLLEEYEF